MTLGLESEGPEAIGRIAPLWYSYDPFPLTPALSLRERENQGRHCDSFNQLGCSNALPIMLPLPEGEGRGEGEQALQSTDTLSFPTGPGVWDFSA